MVRRSLVRAAPVPRVKSVGVRPGGEEARVRLPAELGLQLDAGVHAAPTELPGLLDRMYGLSEEEWLEVGVAYAYGQKLSREDLEDVRRFREFYTRVLAEEGEAGEVLTRKTRGA